MTSQATASFSVGLPVAAVMPSANRAAVDAPSPYPYAHDRANGTSLDLRNAANWAKPEEEDGDDAEPGNLGWRDVPRDDPSVDALRKALAANNGLKGVQMVSPEDVALAASLFYRDGFVVLADVVPENVLNELREAAISVAHGMVAKDRHRRGNRGSHRYSYMHAFESGACLHLRAWTNLVDLPRLTPVLTHIFDSPDYRLAGGGGDFVLPGCVHYQPLHSDISDRKAYRKACGEVAVHGSFRDPRGILTTRDLPCPFVSCNFVVDDLDALNGPIRQIPGTQHSREPTPSLADEPAWMRHATLNPVPKGSVIVRDVRAWHGGTPNLSDSIRVLPNVEFFAPWFRSRIACPMLPRSLHAELSPHAQELAELVVEAPGRGEGGQVDDRPCEHVIL